MKNSVERIAWKEILAYMKQKIFNKNATWLELFRSREE